jgi:hypothetical protein
MKIVIKFKKKIDVGELCVDLCVKIINFNLKITKVHT